MTKKPLTAFQIPVWEAIKEIAVNGLFEPKALSVRTGKSQQNTTRYLKELISRGYVKHVSIGLYKVR